MGAGAIPLGGPVNINDFASGNGNFDPKTGQMNTIAQTTANNAMLGSQTAPTYKDPNSPAAQGKVWSETQGQWVDAGPNSGAMPSSNIGILSPAMSQNPDGSMNYGTPQPVTGTFPTSSSTGGLSTLVPQQPNAPTVGNANTATLGTGQTSSPYQGSSNPYIQAAQATTMGNLYGAQAATQANRINQNTPYGSLNYTQGVDANGNPTWTANQQLSQPLQNLTNTSLQGLQQSLQNPMYGINPGQTYSDAIMQRLSPQLAQQSESNTAALANQGIVPGTKAYENAMRTFQQGQNDLRTSAQIQGMQTGLQAQQLQNQQAANIKALGVPNYINPYSQAAVAGPDYLGAYTTANAADIAKQNAANAKAANMQSGLFGLGNSALLGAGGVGNLIGNTGLNGGTASGLLGIGGSAYNMFGNNGLNNPFVSSTDYMNNIGATGSGAFDPALSNSSYLENLYGNLGIF
jgi:hypothetical protein